MPESPARDSAITGLSSRLAWEDPNAAIAWAETIQTEGQRIDTLSAIGRAWAHKDFEAAQAWAAEVGLPEKAQQAIAKVPEQRRRRRD